MPDLDSAKAVARTLSQASSSWGRNAVFADNDGLQARATSMLAYALNDEAIEYATATVPTQKDGEIVAWLWTQSRAVVLRASSESCVCETFPRAHLARLELLSTTNLYDQAGWNGYLPFSARLTYPHGTVVVPSEDRFTSEAARDAAEAFFPALLADLGSDAR